MRDAGARRDREHDTVMRRERASGSETLRAQGREVGRTRSETERRTPRLRGTTEHGRGRGVPLRDTCSRAGSHAYRRVRVRARSRTRVPTDSRPAARGGARAAQSGRSSRTTTVAVRDIGAGTPTSVHAYVLIGAGHAPDRSYRGPYGLLARTDACLLLRLHDRIITRMCSCDDPARTRDAPVPVVLIGIRDA